MPAAEPVAAGAGNDQQPAQQPGMMRVILQVAVMYMIFKYMTGGGSPATPQTPIDGNPAVDTEMYMPPVDLEETIPTQLQEASTLADGDVDLERATIMDIHRAAEALIPNPDRTVGSLLRDGEYFDLFVYLSESPRPIEDWETAQLLWHEVDVPFDQSSLSNRAKNVTLKVPEGRQESLEFFAHIVVARSGVSIDPDSDEYSDLGVFYVTHPLTFHAPRPKRKQVRSLLDNWNDAEDDRAIQETNEEPESSEDRPIVNLWKPMLAVQMVYQFSRFAPAKRPPVIGEHLSFHESGQGYRPVLMANEFWLLRDMTVELNSSTTEVQLEMTYESLSMWKWQLQLQMDASWKVHESWGTSSSEETDEMKRMFIETNIYLLAITVVVTLLHSVFDFLAFKNDIQFWKNTKSMEGLSARTVAINLFFQVVITLYLFDNETSWVILISNFVGLAIEGWKFTRAMTVNFSWKANGMPSLSVADKESYSKSKTREYDQIAMSHLGYAFYPLVVGYAVYSLYYEQHKSWYSWVLSTLVGFVYMFGFILMTPQLFINYKMKSVAHMPWKVMVYKALNTFIDDLFAFIIKMPTMHRISCFRDDFIFFIYVYQRWAYPVDLTRKNEFGASAEDYKLAEEAKRQGLSAPVLHAPKRGKYQLK